MYANIQELLAAKPELERLLIGYTPEQQQVYLWTIKWKRFYEKNLLIKAKIEIGFSNRMTHTAGKCMNYGNHHFKLRFGGRFLSHPKYEQTVAHEISHVFADLKYGLGQHHNYLWVDIMRMSNFSARRCHQYPTAPRKTRESTMSYLCINCGRRYRLGKNLQDKIMAGAKAYSKCGFPICLLD